jgi:hypothetical protein
LKKFGASADSLAPIFFFSSRVQALRIGGSSFREFVNAAVTIIFAARIQTAAFTVCRACVG